MTLIFRNLTNSNSRSTLLPILDSWLNGTLMRWEISTSHLDHLIRARPSIGYLRLYE